MEDLTVILGAQISVRVHPVVVFTILDQYRRRNADQDRVIGTLLGNITADGIVEIKNSYQVPHQEKDQVLHHLLPPLWRSANIHKIVSCTKWL